MKAYPFLFTALLLLTACDSVDAPDYMVVGTVARPRIELIAESNDVITAIHVNEGDLVTRGELILEQDPALYQIRLEQLQAVSDRTAARLAELVRGARPETITAARAKLQGATNNLAVQEREYVRVSRMVADKLASASLLDQVLALKDSAVAAQSQAKAELDALLSGTTIEELDQIRAALAEATAAVNAQQTLLQRLTITAPANGIIDALPYESGERPIPGATVAVMLAEQLPYARVYIPEPIRSTISAGSTATIQVDGIATAFEGKVRYISMDAAFTPYYALTQRDRSRLSYLAEIDFIENSAADIPAGVPVEVHFAALDTTPEE